MSSYNYKEGLGIGVWGLKGVEQRDKTRDRMGEQF